MRQLRDAAGLTREEVAERTNLDQGTLWRIETARARRPQRRTLLAILDVYGVDEAKRDELLALSREATKPGLMQPYHDELPQEYATYVGFEAEARVISNYESLFVPGLLQTEDYARAVIRGVLPSATSKEVEQRVRVRMDRQALLAGDDPLKLWAIVDEAALHRLVGGAETMNAQMRRLVETAAVPHVTLQVIAWSVGAHAGMPGSFVLMDFPDPSDPPVVYIDSMAGDLFLEAEPEVRRYRGVFEHLRAVALSPGDSTSLIAQIAAGGER
jgi:transcriptional regulator with XRE-family HTH domain